MVQTSWTSWWLLLAPSYDLNYVWRNLRNTVPNTIGVRKQHHHILLLVVVGGTYSSIKDFGTLDHQQGIIIDIVSFTSSSTTVKRTLAQKGIKANEITRALCFVFPKTNADMKGFVFWYQHQSSADDACSTKMTKHTKTWLIRQKPSEAGKRRISLEPIWKHDKILQMIGHFIPI